MSGFGGGETILTHNCVTAELGLALNKNNEVSTKMDLLVTDKICEPIESIKPGPCVQELNKKGLSYADEMPTTKSMAIDILIGANKYWQIASQKSVQLDNGPMAIETLFG